MKYTVKDLLNKFNIPNKELFEELYDIKVSDKLIKGELRKENQLYIIEFDGVCCRFNMEELSVALLVSYGDALWGGKEYGVHGWVSNID